MLKLRGHGWLIQRGVVAFLGFCWRDVADWCQQASVIEPIYPFQGGEFHGLEAAPRPAAVNDLCLVKPVDGLGERVVVTVADAADGRLNPGLKQPFRIFYRDILAAPVAVMDQAAAMQGPPVMQSLLQRIKHEPRMRRAADTPADDPAGKGINDEGDINKASPGRDISEVRDPKPVRRRSLEFPIDVIPRTGAALSEKVVRRGFTRTAPSIPFARIRRATVQRATLKPSRPNWRQTFFTP